MHCAVPPIPPLLILQKGNWSNWLGGRRIFHLWSNWLGGRGIFYLWLGGRDGDSGLGVVVDVRLGARGGEAGGERARTVEGRGGPGQVAAVQRVVDSVHAQVVV